MRPTVSPADGQVYECFVCGQRVDSPKNRECEACEGALRRLGQSRDL